MGLHPRKFLRLASPNPKPVGRGSNRGGLFWGIGGTVGQVHRRHTGSPSSPKYENPANLVKQGKRKVLLFSPLSKSIKNYYQNKVTAKITGEKSATFLVKTVYLQGLHSAGPEVVLKKQGVARATQVRIFI